MEDEEKIEVVEKRVKPTVIRRRKRAKELKPAAEEQSVAETQEAAEAPEAPPLSVEATEEIPPKPEKRATKEARKKEPRVAKIPKGKTKPARVVGRVDLKAAPPPPDMAERLREEKPLEAVEEVAPEVLIEEVTKGKKIGRRKKEELEEKPKKRPRRRREVITIEKDALEEVRVPAARRGERVFPGRPGKKKVITRPHLKTQITTPKAIKKVIKISEVISVGELAQRMGAKVGQVMKKLMDLGVMTAVTQTIDVDTAALVAAEFGYEVESVAIDVDKILQRVEDSSKKLLPRPPVVTIMGHVDHGKPCCSMPCGSPAWSTKKPEA